MNKQYDLIIIGAGPAGLTAALYAKRANLDVLIIEEKTSGGKLININKIDNYPGFDSISGFELANRMIEQLKPYNVLFKENKVVKVKENTIFLDNKEELTSKAILVATGSNQKKLDLKRADEYEGKGISYCATCDGFFFKNKDVIVIGNNNQALEESLYLSNLASKITIINDQNKLQADDYYIEKINNANNIEVINNAIANNLVIIENKIGGIEILNSNTNKTQIVNGYGIFPYISQNPGTSFLDKQLKDNDGYVIVNENMETKTKGIYAAGDCVKKNLRQIVTACSDGAIAATSIIKYLKNKI